MKSRSIQAVVTAGLLLAVCGQLSAKAQDAAPLVVKTGAGAVKGAVRNDILSFKGVPYAAAPVGDLRWRPPQAVKPWSGVRPAADYGADCMQNPFPGDAAPLGVKPDEDCLYANVWRPAKALSGKAPVMVWIYGGGYVNGGSSPAVYDGSEFAKAGIVFVSFNYRLGRFAYFAHPALSAEAKARGESRADYGVMDQVAALKWVKANIAAFGGDPDQVTLFGESAGGGSVLTLMTTDSAKGLFQRAIVESGGGRRALLPMRHVSQDQGPLLSAEKVGLSFAKAHGIEGEDAVALTKLRALSATEVTSGLNMMSIADPTYVGGPIRDDDLIKAAPDAVMAAGKGSLVPLMIGANTMDIGFFQAKDKDALFASFGPDATAARALYDPMGDAPLAALTFAVAGDAMMVEPARHFARLISSLGAPVYEYRFGYVASSMRDAWPAAPHATEIPYVFKTVAARYGDKLTPADAAAAKSANAYWISFAKSANPGDAGGALWPRYDAKSDLILAFTPDGPKAEKDPDGAKLDLIEKRSER